MATVEMDYRRNQAYLKIVFAVQLAWMYMLVVISNEVIFGGSAKAHFSLIVQE